MAKSTRKLNIVVSVRDQTKKALGGIRARIKRFSQATGKAIGRAFKVGLAAAGVALAVFVANVKRQFDEIDRLAKDAFRFGIPIEQIAGLELAASLAGVSLNQMMTIMRDMQRRVSEAAQGTGEAKDALVELGLSAEDLNNMGLVEQFETIRKALKGQKNENDRNRIAYELMGRSGVQAMTMINSSIMENVLETEILGSKLNDEITGNIQDANDELTRMKEAFRGIVRVVAAELAPSLENLFRQMRQDLVDIRLGATVLIAETHLSALQLFRDVFSGLYNVGVHIEKFLYAPLNKALEAANMLAKALGSSASVNRIMGPAEMLKPFATAGLDLIIAQMRADIDKKINQAGNLFKPGEKSPFDDDDDDELGGAGSRPRPAGMPGLTGGRLLTGAAQSSAERLATIQREADAERAREAANAAKQRDKQNALLSELLRSAVQNPNAFLGGLLQ